MKCYNLLLSGVSWGMEALIAHTPVQSMSTESSDHSLPSIPDGSPAHLALRCGTLLTQFVDEQIDEQTLQQRLVIVNTDVSIRDACQQEAAAQHPDVVSYDQHCHPSHEGSFVADMTPAGRTRHQSRTQRS